MNDRNPQTKIDGLVALGLLTKENANFLQSPRIMGNQASHQFTPHSDKNSAWLWM